MYKPLEDRASWFETGLKAARKRRGERPRALRRFEEGDQSMAACPDIGRSAFLRTERQHAPLHDGSAHAAAWRPALRRSGLTRVACGTPTGRDRPRRVIVGEKSCLAL